MNKFVVIFFIFSASTSFGQAAKTLLSCGEYQVKFQPTDTKKPSHFLAGSDVKNANVWVEQKGKKLEVKMTLDSEGGSFEGVNLAGEPIKIRRTGQSTYGVISNGNLASKCDVAGMSQTTVAENPAATLLDCGEYVVKIQPNGGRATNNYIAGVDVINADSWIEEHGKKLETKLETNSEGGTFTATNSKGELIKVARISRSDYGTSINSKRASECKAAASPRRAAPAAQSGAGVQ